MQRFKVQSRLVAAAVSLVALGGSATSASSTPDGEPIVIMMIGSLESPQFSNPHVQTAIEARVKAINADGGINGRPLEAEFCNDKFDPNEAAACARRAADVGAVAVVGGVTVHAAAIFPVLTESGIPWIGGSGSSGPIEVTDPISYPIQGGSPAMLLGLGHYMVSELGAQKIAIVTDDNPASAAGTAVLIQGVEQAGGQASASVAPPGTVDYTAIVASALSGGADAVATTAAPPNVPKVVVALREAGFEGVIGIPNSNFPPPSIEAVGDDANDIYLSFRMVPSSNQENATTVEFLEQILAEDPDVNTDELALNAWTAVGLFAAAAGAVDTVDSASIREYLDTLPDGPIELGSVPAYGSLEAPADYPRARNFVALIAQVQDGAVVQMGDFFDPTSS